MTQTIAIILKFRDEQARQFEEMFRAEVIPLWQEFAMKGKFIEASLSPVEGGGEEREGIRQYILHVEVPGMAEHEEFDEHPKFLEFLPKARTLQLEKPQVFFGTTLFKVGARGSPDPGNQPGGPAGVFTVVVAEGFEQGSLLDPDPGQVPEE